MLLNVEIIYQGRDNLAHENGPAVIEEKIISNWRTDKKIRHDRALPLLFIISIIRINPKEKLIISIQRKVW